MDQSTEALHHSRRFVIFLNRRSSFFNVISFYHFLDVLFFNAISFLFIIFFDMFFYIYLHFYFLCNVILISKYKIIKYKVYNCIYTHTHTHI